MEIQKLTAVSLGKKIKEKEPRRPGALSPTALIRRMRPSMDRPDHNRFYPKSAVYLLPVHHSTGYK